MSRSSTFCLIDLPVELLEQILLHLPGQDIVKMEVINRRFQDLTRSSLALQYRRELFAAGLIDNPQNHCDLEERRRLCKEYVHKWSDAAVREVSLRDVPLEQPFSDWYHTKVLGGNLLASPSHDSNHIKFLRVPSARSGKQTEQWCIRFPFTVLRYAAYPPENILAVAELKEGFVQIHLLNPDGSPYRVSPLNVIKLEIPGEAPQATVNDLAMTGSRLMLRVHYVDARGPAGGSVWRIVIWDWKTGDLVFDLSNTDESDAITSDCQIDFFDEFRIIVTHDDHATDISVFNTLVPQDHPGNFLRFKLPWEHFNPTVRIHLDRDRPLGIVSRDGPLITDPTQDVFIVDSRVFGRRIFLILRKQLVIGYTCSEYTDVPIPWNEWGKDAVFMDIPVGYINSNAVVHGSRVLVVGCKRGHQIRAFDFNRKGIADLPLLDDDDGKRWRSAALEDGFMLKGDEELDPWQPYSLGDRAAFSFNRSSYLEPHSNHSKHIMRIFDMI